MPRVVAVILYLMLTAEDAGVYSGLLVTPFQWPEQLLFGASFLKLPLWTYAQLGLLVALGGKGPAPRMRARPMDRALLASVGCVGLWAALGAARGGNLQQMGFQVFCYLNSVAFAFLVLAVMRTPAHYAMLLKAIVAAAVHRSIMAIGFYLFVVRDLSWKNAPEFMTTHADSALFVTGLAILIANAVEGATKRAGLLLATLGPLILVAIQVNNRRLAWMALVSAIAVLYGLLPPSPRKRRVNRLILAGIPALALYVAVGWGRTERIFKPLASFDSATSEKDASTRSRDNENDGLILTFSQGPTLGTGWGLEYIETDSSLSARGFAQYRYIPHNSLLAILAFAGWLGFAGILMPIPVAVYLNTRTYRVASAPVVRVVAMVGVAEVAICLNQIYGDMGLFSRTNMVILATGLASAGRLSVWCGAWPGARNGDGRGMGAVANPPALVEPPAPQEAIAPPRRAS
jgi:O-antigen ligase/polysaccharide polymerase Wzy-like membrane protein